MSITVDYTTTPWLITIPKSDLTLESGTKYILTVDVFWQLLRDYADSDEGIIVPNIYSRIPATSSTPSITDVNLDYFGLQFEDGLYSVNVLDGNTNIRDAEVKNQVSVNTNNTTGFINPEFLEFSTFDGHISVDETNGVAGTDYPNGTPAAPVNNWIDANNIATTRGIKEFFIIGDSLLTGALDFSDGHIFTGFSPVSVLLNVDTSVNVAKCEFKSVYITGVLDGNSVFRDCITGDVNYINGFIYNCALNGKITLGGGANASIKNCWQNFKGQVVEIDMGGSGQQLTVANYDGEITVSNCTGLGQSFISGRGHVTIDSTISSGTFTLYGDLTYTNNSTGTAVLIDYTSSALTWKQSAALTLGKYLGLK